MTRSGSTWHALTFSPVCFLPHLGTRSYLACTSEPGIYLGARKSPPLPRELSPAHSDASGSLVVSRFPSAALGHLCLGSQLRDNPQGQRRHVCDSPRTAQINNQLNSRRPRAFVQRRSPKIPRAEPGSCEDFLGGRGGRAGTLSWEELSFAAFT